MPKRHIVFTVVSILFIIIILCSCGPEFKLDASTTAVRTGTVTDRAMATPSGGHKIWDKSYTYIIVKFEDGTSVCLWNKPNINIPEDIGIGDTVEVIYSLEQNTELWLLTRIKTVR